MSHFLRDILARYVTLLLFAHKRVFVTVFFDLQGQVRELN